LANSSHSAFYDSPDRVVIYDRPYFYGLKSRRTKNLAIDVYLKISLSPLARPPLPPIMNSLNRRQLLQLTGFAGMGLLLDSCGLNQYSTNIGNTIDPLNQRVEELLLNPQALAREYPVSEIDPKALIINSFTDAPEIDPTTFKLIIDGAVNQPMQLSMSDIKKLPLRSIVIQHVCVEGWAAIVQWGGVRLKDLIALAQPKNTARYVYFESGDGYYNSWDLPSAMHPQTLLAYQKKRSAASCR
jgi:Oxidoreductase molybdopterin binding domain